MANDLAVYLENGTRLIVPNRLDAMTTYVVLEQERWFEKEWGFIPRLLQTGMTVLDIGANLGIYTMAMAKCVGPAGHVFAYEPTSTTRSRLAASKALNNADNITIIGSALSDTQREGRIVFGASSELNHLGSSSEGAGEAVHLTSLDLEKDRLGWKKIDFIKMDAEGEELRIIEGGRRVFEDDSPIVMFEIKAAEGYEPAIGGRLKDLGYELYRLLPDEEHLVPFDESELDGFELNLFALKPSVANDLARREVVVTKLDSPAPSGDWASWSGGRPYGQMLTRLPPAVDADLKAALDYYAAWRDPDISIGLRYAALLSATQVLSDTLKKRPTVASLVAAARAYYDAGRRTDANGLTAKLAALLNAGEMPQEPFVPVLSRYENQIGDLKGWLQMAIVEALDRSVKFSSFFSEVHPQLELLAGSKYVTPEIERRRVLSAVIRGKDIQLRLDLSKPMPGHLNAQIWSQLIG